MEADGLSWANMGVNGTAALDAQFRWIPLTSLKLKEALKNPLRRLPSLRIMVNAAGPGSALPRRHGQSLSGNDDRPGNQISLSIVPVDLELRP
jgi:hypothetical protein